MKTYVVVVVAAALVAGLSGCDRLQSGYRLRLPAGSAENGRVAFVALKCTKCHTVAGVDLPKPTVKPEEIVELGGGVRQLRTVGDLLTSIIHPTAAISDKLLPPLPLPADTPMPSVNDEMTVTQMVDLVRFLQPRYTQMAPPVDWTFSY